MADEECSSQFRPWAWYPEGMAGEERWMERGPASWPWGKEAFWPPGSWGAQGGADTGSSQPLPALIPWAQFGED